MNYFMRFRPRCFWLLRISTENLEEYIKTARMIYPDSFRW